MAASDLTAQRLRELLDYDPETGVFTWRASCQGTLAGAVAGCRNKRGYVNIGVDYGKYRAHRLAWLHTHGVWPTHRIDHRNGVFWDNRLDNLRDCTQAINNQNHRAPHSNNTSGLLGAFRKPPSARGKPWRSQIRVDGKIKHLGRFNTPEEAHQAYLRAKRIMHPGNTL